MKTFNNDQTALQPTIKKSGNSNGLLQVINTSGTPVYLFGSLDGTNYVLIESFSADTIKEVMLCPFMKIGGNTAGSSNATNNVVKLFEYNA
jgi:hypothetical protein|tara:strand:+ start:863 stop:1135 length:273 start_codon:yes stop_codon:yes gene_type:complete